MQFKLIQFKSYLSGVYLFKNFCKVCIACATNEMNNKMKGKQNATITNHPNHPQWIYCHSDNDRVHAYGSVNGHVQNVNWQLACRFHASSDCHWLDRPFYDRHSHCRGICARIFKNSIIKPRGKRRFVWPYSLPYGTNNCNANDGRRDILIEHACPHVDGNG